MDELIISPANPRIKRLIRLRDRRHRDQEGVFLVEGRALLERAVAAGLKPAEVYYDPEVLAAPPVPASELVAVTGTALDRASYRARSQGVIAVFPQFPLDLERIGVRSDALVLASEGLEKPGNLGALLRIADAAGVEAVVAVDPATDPFNPNVVRASTGALFTVPLAVAGLGELLSWAKRHRLTVLAADPAAAVDLWSVDLTGGFVLLVGSEHQGLTPEARKGADRLISIPMSGRVDSLNASVTAALLVYEARRQRRQAQGGSGPVR